MSPNMQTAVKFDGSNYFSWKVHVSMTLNLNGCGSALVETSVSEYKSETVTSVSESKSETETANTIAINGKAVAILLGSMEDHLLWDYHLETKAHAIWKILETKYGGQNLLVQQQAETAYVNLEFTGYKSTIASFKQVVSNLRACGSKKEDFLLCNKLLNILPAKWTSVVEGIKSRDSYTLAYVLARLESDYLEKQSIYEVKERANLVTRTEHSSKFGGACWNCGGKGHRRSECKKKSSKVAHDEQENNANKDNQKYLRLSSWCVDSGASSHMTPKDVLFTTFTSTTGKEVVTADGTALKILGHGTVNLKSNIAGKTIRLKNVLLVPDLQESLISVQKLNANGVEVLFSKMGFVLTRGTEVLGCGKVQDGLFQLQESAMKSTEGNASIWHARFGHTPVNVLKSMVSKKSIQKIEIKGAKCFCDVCAPGKSHRIPFSNHDPTIKDEDILHADLAGPFKIPTFNDELYYMVIVDGKGKYVTGYLMKRKNEAFDFYKEYECLLETQHNRKVKVFRTDNGTEFLNEEFRNHLREKGTVHQTTCRYSPQQNGVAERMNRTIMNKVRCLLIDSNSDLRLWGEAFKTAIYLINRISSGKLTPVEEWSGIKPNVSHLRRFGCVAFMHIPVELRTKLDSRAEKRIFVGYSESQKGVRLFDPDTKSVQVSRDVLFNELENWEPEKKVFNNQDLIAEWEAELPDVEDDEYIPPVFEMENHPDAVREMDNQAEAVQDEDAEQDETWFDAEENGEVHVPRRNPTRQCNGPINYALQVNEPSSFRAYQRMEEQEQEGWTKAMEKEMNALSECDVWELVPLPEGRKAITSKWVFKEKLDGNGHRERLKARLVAMGNTQKEGLDYSETFAPVLHANSFRTLLAIATELNLNTNHMDVESAFLYGDLNEEIYMKQPQGFIDPALPSYVCRLKKSLYGLKQAPRMWNQKINSYLIQCGFSRCITDPCLYFKSDGKSTHIIGLFVDDLLQAASTSDQLAAMKEDLEKIFKMKDLGEPTFCLGIEIKRDMEKKMTKIGLGTYTRSLLKEFGMEDCNKCDTPQDINSKLPVATKTCKIVDPDRYRQAVGSLTYLMSRTRPDIACAVRSVSEHLVSPTTQAWAAVKRIFRYLKGTQEYGITYYASGTQMTIQGLSDADWGSCLNTRRSITGSLVYIGRNLVMWRSKKQKTTALSSTEAEYMALSDTLKEVLWLKQLMSELGYHQKEAITMYEDNVGCIKMASNPITMNRSKHIDIKHHFIRNHVENGTIIVKHKPGIDMAADILTKGVSKDSFQKHRKELNVGELGLRESVSEN